MSHSLKVNKTKDGKEGVLSFSGDLLLAEAQETKQCLLEAIQKVDKLYLDLSQVKTADISFIQLLCSAHRESFLSQKEIIIQGEMNESVNLFLETAGYTKHHGCIPKARSSCLWRDYSSCQ